MRKYFYFLFIILLFSFRAEGKGIKFHNDILEEALEMAKTQGKYVFIDTYAPWCAPCKRMNKVFTDPNVGSFFNEKFINVKINMDGNLGKQMLLKYDVVWLPTLLILDEKGNVKYKVDKEVPAEDLIKMANNALDPNFQFYNAPTYSKSPIVKTVRPTTKTVIENPLPLIEKEANDVVLGVTDIPNEPERILYVYNENSSSDHPEILFHEAYLQMQLMDSKMYETVDKYLSTQTDWTTEKNIKFIFDFVENTRSKYFDFFSSNTPLFEKYLGKEKVIQNLEIMVYMKLYNGYPRPSLNEAIELFEYIDQEKGKQKAYLYYLQRLKSYNNTSEFITVSDEFLSNINSFNAAVIKESTHIKLNNNLKGLPISLKFIDKALGKQKKNIGLILLKAKVLNRLGRTNDARTEAKKALKLAKEKNLNRSEIIAFLSEMS